MINMDEIRKLSVEERIRLVEDIWDTIAASPEGLELTEAQRSELERRLDLHARDPQGRPLQQIVDELYRPR